jgi:hypothetical protein
VLLSAVSSIRDSLSASEGYRVSRAALTKVALILGEIAAPILRQQPATHVAVKRGIRPVAHASNGIMHQALKRPRAFTRSGRVTKWARPFPDFVPANAQARLPPLNPGYAFFHGPLWITSGRNLRIAGRRREQPVDFNKWTAGLWFST